MNFYYSYESTPLKFHNAFYKVISPILIAIHVLNLISTIGYLTDDAGDYNSGLLVLNLFFSVLIITFLGFMTYGFLNKKTYAWYTVYAFLVFDFLSSIISSLSNPSALPFAAIIPTLIGIYYYKRKPLFVTSETNNYSASTNETATTNRTFQNSASPYSAEKMPQISYCRKCGNRVTGDSVFCNKCGTKIHWN